jgi:hypothetical protein
VLLKGDGGRHGCSTMDFGEIMGWVLMAVDAGCVEVTHRR